VTPSLRETVIEILDDFSIPVPTTTVRVIATARRGSSVAAEALSRLAAAQRDEFLRARRPPALCHTIDATGRALAPRVWARGEWRLGRRIASQDTLPAWRATLALGLCGEVVDLGDAAPRQLGEVALEAVARVVGPVATYLPGSTEEWRELRRGIAAYLPPAGVTTLTAEQTRAERRLLEHAPALPAVGLYFGLSPESGLPPAVGEPALVRLPGPDEEGEPFEAVLRRRLGGDPAALRDVVAYLQGYSAILDEWDRAPTLHEFADYWHLSANAVQADEQLFARAFPEEPGPEPMLRMLWKALPRSGAFTWLLGARVIDAAPRADQSAIPAAGQRWRRKDGSAEMTLIEADGDQIVGGLHEPASATTSLWVGSRSQLADWELAVPPTIWRVRFDVDVIPATLIEPLRKAGIVPERVARPGDPRPERAALAVGTVEAHVSAADEDAARRKVQKALRGHAHVPLDEIRVTRPPINVRSDRDR
jgi:hypothetical protein